MHRANVGWGSWVVLVLACGGGSAMMDAGDTTNAANGTSPGLRRRGPATGRQVLETPERWSN